MNKLSGKRLLSCALAAAVVAGVCLTGGLSATASSDYKAPFDENNIVVRFSTISDTHIQTAGSDSTTKFKKAMAQLNKIDDLSAVLINGDVTDYYTDANVAALNDALNQVASVSGFDFNSTKLLLNMGNHELFNAEINCGDQGGGIPTQAEAKPHYHGATTYKEALGDKMYTDDATAEQIELGFQHTKLNGYHVILFSLFDYNHGLRYEAKEFEWLKTALEEAAAEDPDKPIFFAMHAAIAGTNLPSEQGNYWAVDTKELYDLLAQYPQLITFGSHLHYPLQDEREIYQGDFTSVDTGSVYYCSIPKAMTNPITGEHMGFTGLDGSEPSGAFTGFSQGLLVEVDKDNNTRITRLDFINKTTIKDPWIIPAVTDSHHLTQYTHEALAANNTAPEFGKDATVEVLPNDPEADPYKNLLNLTFSTATDNDMVLAYEIKYIEKESGKVINTQYTYSDFYLHPTQANMSDSLDFSCTKRALYPMKPNYPYDYYVEVRAVDTFGMKSDAITSDVVPGDPSGLEEDLSPTLDPQNQWDYKVFTDYNYLEEGYTPQAGVDFDSWPTSAAANFHPYVPVSKNGFAGTTAITKQIQGADNQFDVISWNVNDETFATGYNTDLTGAKEFWVWVDFSDIEFDYFYFGFREGVFYGTEYCTEVKNSVSDQVYYIQDGSGGWKAVSFLSDGKMALGGYKGFIRFNVEYFCNTETQIPMYPDKIKTLKIWFSLLNGTDYTGKTFTIDQVGFAGPSMEGSTMTVGEMKAQDGSAEVTQQELQAAYDNAVAKVDKGQGDLTAKSWKAYTDAVDATKTLLDGTSTADQIKDQYYALKNAEGALSTTDTSALQAAYDQAAAKIEAGQGNYTDGSWQALSSAYEAAGTVLGSVATQQTIDDAARDLLAALDGLVENQTSTTTDTTPTTPTTPSTDGTQATGSSDMTALKDLCDKAKALVDAGQGDYTDASWTALKNAYSAASQLLGGTNPQNEVDGAARTLQAAIDGLKAPAATTTTATVPQTGVKAAAGGAVAILLAAASMIVLTKKKTIC